jgi:hypothetical protein
MSSHNFVFRTNKLKDLKSNSTLLGKLNQELSDSLVGRENGQRSSTKYILSHPIAGTRRNEEKQSIPRT